MLERKVRGGQVRQPAGCSLNSYCTGQAPAAVLTTAIPTRLHVSITASPGMAGWGRWAHSGEGVAGDGCRRGPARGGPRRSGGGQQHELGGHHVVLGPRRDVALHQECRGLGAGAKSGGAQRVWRRHEAASQRQSWRVAGVCVGSRRDHLAPRRHECRADNCRHRVTCHSKAGEQLRRWAWTGWRQQTRTRSRRRLTGQAGRERGQVRGGGLAVACAHEGQDAGQLEGGAHCRRGGQQDGTRRGRHRSAALWIGTRRAACGAQAGTRTVAGRHEVAVGHPAHGVAVLRRHLTELRAGGRGERLVSRSGSRQREGHFAAAASRCRPAPLACATGHTLAGRVRIVFSAAASVAGVAPVITVSMLTFSSAALPPAPVQSPSSMCVLYDTVAPAGGHQASCNGRASRAPSHDASAGHAAARPPARSAPLGAHPAPGAARPPRRLPSSGA